MRKLALKAPIPPRRHWKAALSVPLLGASLLVAAACASTTDYQPTPTPGGLLPVVQAGLVAPPAVPAPIERNTPAHVVVDLTAVEKTQEIAPGVQYDVWSFNTTVPAPMIRARVGDTVEIRLANLASNTQAHNIDLHAVNGPGGGAEATLVNPGEQRSFTFQAKHAGLFAYHCAAGQVTDHISNGMYGGILIEPASGMPSKVDHEYYVGQSEFYTTGDTGSSGHQDLDYDKMQAEQPTYVVFNGNTKSLVGDNALRSNVRDKVRLFVVDGGPNLTSSFHVIGEIFDRAWQYGTLEDGPMHGIQTVLIPPGGAAITEFETDVPGDYVLVDHALSRVALGAAGILHVTGDPNPDIFNELNPTGSDAPSHMEQMQGSQTATAAATTPPATEAPATTTPVVSAPTSDAGGTTVTIDMNDNFFEPKNVVVPAGQLITFQLVNEGKIPHDFAVANADGSYGNDASDLVKGGKDTTFQWQAPGAPGTYNFRCNIHAQQMEGTITVQ